MLKVDPGNRAAGMYFRMVSQLLAQEEAEDAGVPLEVVEPKSTPPPEPTSEDLTFSFDGEESSVTPVAIQLDAGTGRDSSHTNLVQSTTKVRDTDETLEMKSKKSPQS